jgi:orotate phosphoribosyltransferase-like protein
MRSIRVPWGEFPDVIIQARVGDAKKHPLYYEAKAGNAEAALEVVSPLINAEKLDQIATLIGDERPVVIAVHAEESVSYNEIPQAYAEVLSRYFYLETDTHIVQAIKVSRNETNGFYRLANQPYFDGRVVRGSKYIIVDDTLTQGGTLANLRGHIEHQGGRVLFASTLTGKQYSAKLALTPQALLETRQLYATLEPWWIKYFGYGFDRLTESEARYIIKNGQAIDTLRNRIIESRQA